MSGTLKKLKIISFKDRQFSQKAGSVEVSINPAQFKHSHTTEFETTRTTDKAGITQKFVGINPESMSFELYFDATLNGSPSVQDAIKTFKDVAYEYDGELHSTKYLKVLWGKFQFKCRLKTLDIDYTLFAPSGTPLRAKATVEFEEYISPKELILMENDNSPDLTHVRTVKAGDTLPLMCHTIYRDAKYYLYVADFNGLTDFRNLEPGTKITFPPLSHP